MKDKKESGRTRNFTAVVYPDSAPDNWQSILADTCIPSFISPLHDSDVNEVTGKIKKPHYHVVLMFDSVKTIEQAKAVFDSIGAVPPPSEKIIVQSIRGVARYLCHLDNPEKVLYCVEDVRSLGGADYINTISLVTDRYFAISEMIAFCSDNMIFSYSDLLEYCMSNRPDWFRILCDSGTFVIKEYLKSKKWSVDLKALEEKEKEKERKNNE